MSSAKTCFIYNLAPFFSALFGYLHFEERMTVRKWAGLLISFFGFLPIMLAPAPDEAGLLHVGPLSLAEIALLVATISSVYGWIVMQDIVRRRHFSPLLANGLSMILGGFFSVIGSLVFEAPYWQPIPLIQWWPFIGWLLAIVICTLIIFTLYAELLKKYTATFMSFSGLTGPLFAAVYDWFFFGSMVSWHFYVATFLVFVGLYLFYQEDLRQGYLVS